MKTKQTKCQNPIFLVTKFRQRRLPLYSNFISLSVSILNLDHYSVFSHILLFSVFLRFLEVVSQLHLSSLNAFFLNQRMTQPPCSPLPPKTGRDLCHYETVISFFLNLVEVNFQDSSSRPNCKVPFNYGCPSPAHSFCTLHRWHVRM